ncbi:MAG: hypothetical protein WC355_03390 [Candidatus Omnitrophota bacterium]|jgi:hypothetical protein
MSGNRLKRLFLTALFILSASVFSSARADFVYEVKGERNPFMPLVTPEGVLIKVKSRAASGTLDIEGIIYDKTALSYAIVNGLVVKVGDYVGDNQVLKIEEKKVVFIKDGQAFEVDLKKEEE